MSAELILKYGVLAFPGMIVRKGSDRAIVLGVDKQRDNIIMIVGYKVVKRFKSIRDYAFIYDEVNGKITRSCLSKVKIPDDLKDFDARSIPYSTWKEIYDELYDEGR